MMAVLNRITSYVIELILLCILLLYVLYITHLVLVAYYYKYSATTTSKHEADVNVKAFDMLCFLSHATRYGKKLR